MYIEQDGIPEIDPESWPQVIAKDFAQPFKADEEELLENSRQLSVLHKLAVEREAVENDNHADLWRVLKKTFIPGHQQQRRCLVVRSCQKPITTSM